MLAEFANARRKVADEQRHGAGIANGRGTFMTVPHNARERPRTLDLQLGRVGLGQEPHQDGHKARVHHEIDGWVFI